MVVTFIVSISDHFIDIYIHLFLEPAKITLVSVTSSNQNRPITEGDTVSLECNTTGFPSPEVTWSRADGKALFDTAGGGFKYVVSAILQLWFVCVYWMYSVTVTWPSNHAWVTLLEPLITQLKTQTLHLFYKTVTWVWLFINFYWPLTCIFEKKVKTCYDLNTVILTQVAGVTKWVDTEISKVATTQKTYSSNHLYKNLLWNYLIHDLISRNFQWLLLTHPS